MNLRRILIFIAAIFIIGFNVGQRVQASTIQPGSAEDPIVSVGYVKNYLEGAFKPVSDKLTNIDKDIKLIAAATEKVQQGLNPKVTLTIGKKVATIGNKNTAIDCAPIIYQGRTIVPLRFIGQALSAQVLWDSKKKTVTYKKATKTILLRLNDKKAVVSGKTIQLDSVPVLRDGRMLVPVRFVSENLDAQVDYIAKTKTITIKGK